MTANRRANGGTTQLGNLQKARLGRRRFPDGQPVDASPTVTDKLINFASLGIFTLMLAAGQFLFKQVALTLRGQSIADGLLSLPRQPALYAALGIYGFSTLLWLWILSRVSLMQAYPWVAIGVIIVPLMGRYMFGERTAPSFWFGTAFIAVGILLTQYASQEF